MGRRPPRPLPQRDGDGLRPPDRVGDDGRRRGLRHRVP
jgi:hypothetical protein